MTWLSEAFHFVIGWAGIDTLIGFAAIAVAVLEPPLVAAIIPDLRKWAIATAVVAFTCTGLLAHGYSKGLAEKQAEWDAALAREAVTGEKARDDAVTSVDDATSDSVRNDKRNRDHWKQPVVK